MATPIKSVSSLLVNRVCLSPRTPKLLRPLPFQESVLQGKREDLSPLKLKSKTSLLLSPNNDHENVKCNSSVIGISNTNACCSEDSLTLDSPHKSYLLNYGLNKYDLLYLLGKGSFGTVIKSKYKGNIVAAKLIKLENSSNHINEKNGCNLVHKNIITTLDVIHSDKYALIIMKYYKNSKNLQQVVNENDNMLKEENIIKYSQDIVRGLKYCHDNDVLHLDIKPKNILLCDNGICKICDFGNSIQQFDNKQNFKYQGTIAYTAPEILRGSNPTSKCDIYSLGILIWQLVSKKNPYTSLNNEVVVYKVVKFNFRPPLDFKNRNFSNLCKLCWNENPNLRPSAAELSNMLDAVPHNVNL